ncbi:acylphosphatase [Bifidobacterium scaligerum]|uniref:acylphosphatase n=1 Tax=Bifidobacterium scaligerum TaxID=2052656 RepID=A0A2M9HS30_9BIFI|nr:acylphosphatase [Bifidobacterium scaligerum]PJM79587.1 acylphosphatase [Bifidobacterium scaligerum]
MSMVHKRIIVTGLVQGVGFRYFAVMQARKLGVAGWVCNRRDGSVEADVQGSRESVEDFVLAMRQGPRWAEVEQVKITDMAVDNGMPSSFSVHAD